MSSYEVVDFLDLNPKLFRFGVRKSNNFGGYSVRIRYNGKKLYVRYGEHQCQQGVMRWGNGKFPNYSISFNIRSEDPYISKADELDKLFSEEFGSVWRPIIRESRGSSHLRMEFKLPMKGQCVETRFFGESIPDNLVSKVPKGANVILLALWDNVSIGDDYGAVIKPKAMQIRVCDVPESESESDSDDTLSECLC